MTVHEYALRVRRHGDQYTATLRQLAPAHPDERVTLGGPAIGHGANPSAAIVAAVSSARLPEFTEPRRSPYAV